MVTEFVVSSGTLKYDVTDKGFSKLTLSVDPGIVDLARALVPKYVNLRKQKYPPHISVVRNVVVHNHVNWLKHFNKEVYFSYSMNVFNDEKYYWLRAVSKELYSIRNELGLCDDDQWTKPPDGTRWFHITIGNTKVI